MMDAVKFPAALAAAVAVAGLGFIVVMRLVRGRPRAVVRWCVAQSVTVHAVAVAWIVYAAHNAIDPTGLLFVVMAGSLLMWAGAMAYTGREGRARGIGLATIVQAVHAYVVGILVYLALSGILV